MRILVDQGFDRVRPVRRLAVDVAGEQSASHAAKATGRRRVSL